MASVNECFLYAVICTLLSVVSLLFLTRQQRETLFGYLSVSARGRRISTSKTPPRSVSPETKVPNNGSPQVDFKDAFPPSHREALARAAETLSAEQRKKLIGRAVDAGEFKKGIIPLAADYRDCRASTYTPTEISIEEVKALGDFPDYAALSGVPLPEAYKEFRIETALPRPYRPFRWAYHQTMCMLALQSDHVTIRILTRAQPSPNWRQTGGSNSKKPMFLVSQNAEDCLRGMVKWSLTISQAANLPAKNSWKWSCNSSAPVTLTTFP